MNTFGGNLKMSKEVVTKKNMNGIPIFQHKVHARCEYAGNSRVKDRKRERTDSKLVDSLVLWPGPRYHTLMHLGSCLQLACLWRVTGTLIQTQNNESLPLPPKAQAQLGAYAPTRTSTVGFGKSHVQSGDPFWPLPTSLVRADVSTKEHNLWYAGPVEVREAHCVMKHSEQCPIAN